jgi:hypothetical protein
VKEATCTEDGEVKQTCSVCGATESLKVNKLGHNWDAGVVIKEPTCVDGIKQHTCSTCGAVENRKIDKLPNDAGHDYRIVAEIPPCEEDAYILLQCVHCNKTKKEMGLPMQGHVWVNDECIVCGQKACDDLEYIENADGTYTLYGIGNCRHEKVSPSCILEFWHDSATKRLSPK